MGILESHRGKIFLAIGVVMAALIAGVNYYSYRHWERQVAAIVEQEAMVLARTIEAGLSVFMMEGSFKKIDSLLEFAAEAQDVAYVRIIDSGGVIAASSIPGEEGIPAGGGIESNLNGTSANVDLTPDDELGGSVRIVLPIMNREQCHSCHDQGLVTNGVLDMRLAMGEAMEPLAANRKHMIAFAAVSIIALFGALYMVFRIGRPG